MRIIQLKIHVKGINRTGKTREQRLSHSTLYLTKLNQKKGELLLYITLDCPIEEN